MQLNFAITSLLHISIALEDPFDPQVLDGVFVDEALLEAKLVRFSCLVALPCSLPLLAELCQAGEGCCNCLSRSAPQLQTGRALEEPAGLVLDGVFVGPCCEPSWCKMLAWVSPSVLHAACLLGTPQSPHRAQRSQ